MASSTGGAVERPWCATCITYPPLAVGTAAAILPTNRGHLEFGVRQRFKGPQRLVTDH